MRVAIADLDVKGLESVAQELRALGAKSLSQRTDVTRGDEMGALAERVFDELGGTDLLCNCAGVRSAVVAQKIVKRLARLRLNSGPPVN